MGWAVPVKKTRHGQRSAEQQTVNFFSLISPIRRSYQLTCKKGRPCLRCFSCRYGFPHCVWPDYGTVSGGLPLAIQLFLPARPAVQEDSTLLYGSSSCGSTSKTSLGSGRSEPSGHAPSIASHGTYIESRRYSPPVVTPRSSSSLVSEPHCQSAPPRPPSMIAGTVSASSILPVSSRSPVQSFSPSSSASSSVSSPSPPSLSSATDLPSTDARCGILLVPLAVSLRRHLDGTAFLACRSFVYNGACGRSGESPGGVRQGESSLQSSLLLTTFGCGDVVGALRRCGWTKLIVLMEGEWREASRLPNGRDNLLRALLVSFLLRSSV